MNKKFSLFILTVLILSIFAGCGSKYNKITKNKNLNNKTNSTSISTDKNVEKGTTLSKDEVNKLSDDDIIKASTEDTIDLDDLSSQDDNIDIDSILNENTQLQMPEK